MEIESKVETLIHQLFKVDGSAVLVNAAQSSAYSLLVFLDFVTAQESFNGIGHTQPLHNGWPKQSRSVITILKAAYPPYPRGNMAQENKLAAAELEKLRGTIDFQHILDGAVRYANSRRGQNCRNNDRLSAFLAERKWEVQDNSSVKPPDNDNDPDDRRRKMRSSFSSASPSEEAARN